MSRVFADTHFYIALLNPRDPSHAKVTAWLREHTGDDLVTTAWVVLETANALCKSHRRTECAGFLERLGASEGTTLIPLSDELQRRGLELYASRADKEWSLTDCISFVVMADEELTDALTGDRHFEQAGFAALLA